MLRNNCDDESLSSVWLRGILDRRLLESASSKHCRDGIIALVRSIAVDLEQE